MSKRFTGLLFLISLSFNFIFMGVNAQNCFENIIKNDLYSGSNDLINGTKWTYEKKYLGTPLLVRNYWPIADIIYKGSHYKSLQVNWDLSKSEFIIYHPETGKEKYIVLNKDSLKQFSYFDSLLNRRHLYEYAELKGTKGYALYENVSVGKISYFIKPVLNIESGSVEDAQGEYFTYNEYWLDSGNGYSSFSTKNQLLRLLKNHNAELNRFIRRNNIKISSADPESVIAVLNYFNTLN